MLETFVILKGFAFKRFNSVIFDLVLLLWQDRHELSIAVRPVNYMIVGSCTHNLTSKCFLFYF